MENTIVRNNLLTEKGYTPYCGGCDRMPRTVWSNTKQQFTCSCGWTSSFPAEFINKYINIWHNQTQKQNT